MFEKYTCQITGVAPLILHNGQLADPLNYYAKEMKKVSSKRNKTDADLEELAHLEWLGALYLSDGKVCLPGEVIEAHLVDAAKKSRKGPQAKSALFCDGMFPLQYDGPESPQELWEEPEFRLTTGVRIQRSRIMRTRPIFREWALNLTIDYNPSQLNAADIQGFLTVGGEQIGMCDWRPRFGRYTLA